MAYTPHGPFSNGSAPGLDASLFNDIEGVLTALNTAATDSNISSVSGVMTLLGLIANGAIQPNPTSTVLNGATSGTSTLWQPFTGTFKLVFIYQNSFRNGSGSAQTMALPVAFASQAYIATGSCNLFTILLGGATQNMQQIQTLGSVTSVGSLGTGTFATAGAFDTISFSGNQSTAHIGTIIMLGV